SAHFAQLSKRRSTRMTIMSGPICRLSSNSTGSSLILTNRLLRQWVAVSTSSGPMAVPLQMPPSISRRSVCALGLPSVVQHAAVSSMSATQRKRPMAFMAVRSSAPTPSLRGLAAATGRRSLRNLDVVLFQLELQAHHAHGQLVHPRLSLPALFPLCVQRRLQRGQAGFLRCDPLAELAYQGVICPAFRAHEAIPQE